LDKDVLVPLFRHLLDDFQLSAQPDKLVDVVVYAYGAETFIIRMVNKKMLQEFFAIMPALIQYNPGLLEKIDFDSILKQYLDSIGMHADDVDLSPEAQSQIMGLKKQLEEAAAQIQQLAPMADGKAKAEEKLASAEQELFNYKKNTAVENRLALEKMKVQQLEDELRQMKAKLAVTSPRGMQ
jgi:hypothetical protein